MTVASAGRFMYFAFGSNLLKERLQLANPSATFFSIGRLKNYRLNFGLWAKNVETIWHGGAATIEFCPDSELWGVIWTLSDEDSSNLDRCWSTVYQNILDHFLLPSAEELYGDAAFIFQQDLAPANTVLAIQEGVSSGIYSPLEVSVEMDKGTVLCRTYQMNNFHPCPPSPPYKQVMCMGAEQNGLPEEYLMKLEAIQTNNYSGPSILDKIKTVVENGNSF